jgi:hypothetical protein
MGAGSKKLCADCYRSSLVFYPHACIYIVVRVCPTDTYVYISNSGAPMNSMVYLLDSEPFRYFS